MISSIQSIGYWRWVFGSLASLSCAITLPVRSQIIPDQTLPRASVTTPREQTTVITGGTRAGDNVFHSFQEFSVPTGETASFQEIDPGVANIISRVTGSSASRINGAIETLQSDGSVSSANLFLLNPNGILFGPNATLNIGGSFFATTADRLNFADGFQFRSDGTQSSPLLTVSVPSGLQLGPNSGMIVNRSRANLRVERDRIDFRARGGLQVLPGRTIALVGNGLTLAGGVLVAEAGQIELGSVASTNPAAEVRLNPSETGWQLDYPGVQNFGDIRLNRNAIVNTSGVGGGRIQMQGRQITLTGESVVASTTQGNVNGEAIQVRSTRLDINDTARLTTSSLGSGDSGDISIATRQLNLRSGGQLSAFANNAGDGGDMDISATETVQLDGRGSIRTTRGGGIEQSLTRTGLLSEATDETSRSAQGGTIRLSTQRLQIQNGAQVSASTLGDGRAGRIAVEAEAIALTGVLRNPDGSVNINASGRVLPSGLLTSTQIGATGNGGALSLTTDQLSLQAGAVIRTSTEGLGNAGDIDIRASSIEVRGIAGAGLSPSQISAASGGIFFDPELEISILPQIPTGRGGSLSIQTGDLTVEAGAAIAVGSLSLNPTQGAGSLGIVADNVFWLFRLEYA